VEDLQSSSDYPPHDPMLEQAKARVRLKYPNLNEDSASYPVALKREHLKLTASSTVTTVQHPEYLSEPESNVPIWEDAYPWPTLDQAAYHGVAGDVVRLLEPHTEADPVALLATFIVAFGNAVGPGPHATVGAAQHPARLFACLVGETARGRKGQSLNDTLSVMGQADHEWLESARVSGLGSGEGLIAKLQDRDDGSDHKCAFVVETEFARLLAIFYRQGNTASAVIRDSWDTGRLQVQTRKDPLVANNAHVSVIAHITSDEFRKSVTEIDLANGLVNRFLIVCVRRSKRLPSGGRLQLSDVAVLGRRVAEVLTKGRVIRQMQRTPETESLWETIYNALPDESGILGALTARAEAQMLRLSVAYALLDGSNMIHVEHVQAAKALWDYCSASALYVFGERFGDPLADRLLGELRNVWPAGLDGTQQRDLFRRHVSQTRLDEVRGRLERRGLVVTKRIRTQGRPRTVTTAIPKRTARCDQSDECDLSQPDKVVRRRLVASVAFGAEQPNTREQTVAGLRKFPCAPRDDQ
jgi:hypothetical protein